MAAGIGGFVAFAAAAGLVLTGGESTPSHPDAWDPRVEELVTFVEEERDLRFDHPVHVDFLSEEAFRAEVTNEDVELTGEERAELDDSAGLLRALGLVAGEVDLFAAGNTLSGDGILGYYDPAEQRITMRGEDLSLAVQSTIVHELTHALQDQHVDLEQEFETPEEDAGFHAIVEGDASRIEAAWVASLDSDQAEALADEEADAFEDFEQDVADVPVVLQALTAAPYALGQTFLDLMIARDGASVVDDLLAAPPSTEEHLLDPFSYIGEDAPISVDAPAPDEEGAEVFDEGAFGALGLYLLLIERVEHTAALEAALGWGGDAYVAYTSEGRTCAQIALTGDTPRDTTEMRAALTLWSEAMPGGDAVVRRDGDQIHVRSCDPGAAASGSIEGRGLDGLAVLATRTVIATELLVDGGDEELARCFADGAIALFTLEELADPEGDAANTPEGQRNLEELAASCFTASEGP